MSVIFIEYPKCSTCQKAKKWLEANQIEFYTRHIVEQNPAPEELEFWWKMSGLPLKKFFNTSGTVYKELKLAEKLKDYTTQQQLQLLGSDGMLVKRPLIIGEDFILIGFKEEEWERLK